jgi:benzoylformate decarboxylase
VGTVRDEVRRWMRSVGATTVFGNPGSTELRFFTDWPDDFRYIVGLQESVVVAMADGYAQAAGRPALASLHTAAGVGHGLGNLATAWRNQSPVIVLAGQQSRSLLPGEPYLVARQATEFPRPYVKWAVEPARAADVPEALARAWHVARTPPRGPVFVSVPEDDWEAPAEPVVRRAIAAETGPDPVALQRIAGVLAEAANPALVVGAGVDAASASAAAVALAERLRAAVWVAPVSGRCSFPEDHPAFAGFLEPTRAQVGAALAAHDAVLVVGAPVFTYHVVSEGALLAPGTRLVQVTDDPEQAAGATAGDSVLGSPRLALEALVKMVPEADRPPLSQPARPRRPAPEPAVPLSGDFVVATVAGVLPDRALVVEEAPTHRRAMHDHLPMQPGGFFVAASGGLGWGLPAAVGIGVAEPGRPVVCLVGDGSILYAIQALWTAAQLDLALLVVVLNNAGYAALKAFSQRMGTPGAPGHDLPGIDFCSLARGFGCAAARVEDPAQLEPALTTALETGRPALVDVVVDAEVRPIY